MVRISVNSIGPLVGMEKAFGRLRPRLHTLGLDLSIWDTSGACVSVAQPQCDYCRTISCASDLCEKSMRVVAMKVIGNSESVVEHTRMGCCLIGLPIFRRRRRLVGVAVAGFPAVDLMHEESLANLCDELELDWEVVQRQVNYSARHSSVEAEHLTATLQWLMEAEQVATVARDEIATLSANLTTSYEELNLLYSIAGSMRVTQEPGEFMQNTCNELLEVMDVEAIVSVLSPHSSSLEKPAIIVAGEIDLTEDDIYGLVSSVISPQLALSGRPMVQNNFAAETSHSWSGIVRNFIAVPLVTDESMGVLIGFNKSSSSFDSIDMKLLHSIGNQAAVLLANNRLYADLQNLLMGVLHALTATIDAKDPYTCGHSHRVAMISRRLAKECDLPPTKVQEIYLAGLLHDIGKIGIPEATLRKEGKLTDEEYEDIKRHPDLGSKILGGIRQLGNMMAAIHQHHERPDGRGYPQGLSGEEMTAEAKIIGLADSFDAMTSDRTYRKALPLNMVIDEIHKHAGTQFDQELVDELLSLDLEEFLKEIHEKSRHDIPVNLGEELIR